MSAVDRIGTVLSDIAGAISSLSGQANQLISKAESALQDSTQFPNRGVVVLKSTDYVPEYTQGNEVDGMPELVAPELPPPPNYRMGAIAGPGVTSFLPPVIVEPFVPTPIQPNVPPSPPPGLTYSVDEPSISGPSLPPPPSLTINDSLSLLSIDDLSQELTLNLPPIAFVDIDVDQFTLLDYQAEAREIEGYIYNGVYGIPGINELNDGLKQFTDAAFNTVAKTIVAEIQDRFADPQKFVNQQKEIKLAQMFDEQVDQIKQQQNSALLQITDQSGWDFPAPVQFAMRQHTMQLLTAWVEQAKAQRSTQMMDHAHKMYEVCADIYLQLQEAVENLRIQEIRSVVEAHQAAVVYAKTQTQILLDMFDLENYQQYDLDLKQAGFNIQLFEEQLKADALRYEFVRGQIEAEQLKQSVDTALIQQYEAEAKALESRLRIVGQQLEAARKEEELRKIPVELFRGKVEQFSSLVDAEQANLGKLLAEIEQQELLREIELTKVTSYDTQVKASEARFQAKQGNLEASKATNRARMDAYDGLTKATALPVEYSLLKAQYDLYAHEINAENYIADAELALKFKEMDFEYLKQKREMRSEFLRDMRDLSLDLAQTEIERKQAIAEVAVQCARVIASMAEGAMSAGNMVASATIEELA